MNTTSGSVTAPIANWKSGVDAYRIGQAVNDGQMSGAQGLSDLSQVANARETAASGAGDGGRVEANHQLNQLSRSIYTTRNG